jgi:glycosyltransferase involved in cell wall biosynthesis
LLDRISPDIIYVHNIHGADWPSALINVCARHAPTVWTLHDTWSFTGHCAYFYDCEKFTARCDASCPRSGEYPPLSPKKIAKVWEARKNVLVRNQGITAVTPSRWLAASAEKGLWRDHRIEVIPNSMPLHEFKPLDMKMARAALDIDEGSIVLLAAAEQINDSRKGFATLLTALRSVHRRPLMLVTFGKGRLNQDLGDIKVRQLCFVDPERVKVLAYNAADIFVHPALLDNLPNVVMEAIACGTPVIGFRVGGVPDMVRPGLTGWIASDVSSGGLADVITKAIDDIGKSNELSHSCRTVAEQEFSTSLQANRYIRLFNSLKAK